MLNSPETPIYSKSRTLYGLNHTKAAVRKLNHAILVEGYFDFAQLVQAGVSPVVASCGTALTPHQAQLLRRFTSKVVLSFDPDAAGQNAAVRSCELLVSEGFDVNVAVLPPGADPDTFVQKQGRDAYVERLKASVPYLQFLLDRTAAKRDLNTDEGRRTFLHEMLEVAARIPDAAARDQFADCLAHKARITKMVRRIRNRRGRKISPDRVTAPAGYDRPNVDRSGAGARRGRGRPRLKELEDGICNLRSAPSFRRRGSCTTRPDSSFPSALIERLNDRLAEQVTTVAAEPAGCPSIVRAGLKLLRDAAGRPQQEIDRLRDDGSAQSESQIEQLRPESAFEATDRGAVGR